jgi:pyruvate dehydrogenase (quinone)
MPRVLEIAMRTAIDKRGVAVIVLPGDVGLRAAEHEHKAHWAEVHAPVVLPPASEIGKLAKLLNGVERVTLLCGAGCANGRDQVLKLAATLKAPIVHTLRGKEYIEHDNPHDVGMTGLIGFSSGYHAMLECDMLLMLGTDFPYRQFYPTRAKVAQIDIRGENLGRRARLDLGLVGDVGGTVAALLPKLTKKTDGTFLSKAQAHYRNARKGLDELAVGKRGRPPIHPQYLAKVIDEVAAEDAVFTCDVGETTVWAARYLHLNGKRRLLGSMLHGSMANALPQALGAQAAFPGRQIVSMSGDGGFTMLMGDLLSLRQIGLPVKIVIFNNGVLGFVAMEMKASGFIETGVDLKNPDFAAMARAMGIHAVRVEDPGELQNAIRDVLAHDGPAVLDVVTATQELSMPPTITAEQIKGFSLWVLRAVMSGRGDEVIDVAKTNLLSR